MTTRAKPAPRLVDRLREWNTDGLRLPTSRALFEPVQLRRAAAEVVRRLGDLTPRVPPQFELEAIERTLRNAWNRGALSSALARDLRRAPWVFFFPRARSDRWLGSDPRFVREWVRWYEANRRARVVVALLREFLNAYPEQGACFEELRRTIVRELAIGRSARLERWRERNVKFGLLEKNGPARLIENWWGSDRPFEELMQEAGLSPGLEASAFAEAGTRRLLDIVRQKLARGKTAIDWVERAFAWLGDDSRLRFDSQKVETATAFLEPFIDTAPEPEIQASVGVFLCRSIGDPRIKRMNWQGVPDEVRNVLLRWLVSASLEDFFRVLDATALDSHWRYRKAFWWAYYEAGHISDAWVVLGPEAARLARKNLDAEGAGAARLRSGSGVQANQSVLLMRIAGLTIAEWSHNGSCRVWLDGNKQAPKLYEPAYTKPKLMNGSNEEKPHYGSPDGLWQGRLALIIQEHTGIRMASRDYMPQRPRWPGR